jgi:AraC family transcriptional regulator
MRRTKIAFAVFPPQSAGDDVGVIIEASGTVARSDARRQGLHTVIAVQGGRRGGLSGWQQRRVSDYIDAHLGEALRLAALARLVGLSPFHFARAFKQSFGVPPHRYHIGRRIARAKELLDDRAHSVTAIARDLGFAETSSFSATFRRVTGVSPMRYRRERP